MYSIACTDGPSASATLRARGRVAVGEQDRREAGRVDELARGARTDLADADDERDGHDRLTGTRARRARANRLRWSATSPLPRKRAIAPIAPATPSTSSTRRNVFTAGSVSERRYVGPGRGGASWNRTSDLILIRDAL